MIKHSSFPFLYPTYLQKNMIPSISKLILMRSKDGFGDIFFWTKQAFKHRIPYFRSLFQSLSKHLFLQLYSQFNKRHHQKKDKSPHLSPISWTITATVTLQPFYRLRFVFLHINCTLEWVNNNVFTWKTGLFGCHYRNYESFCSRCDFCDWGSR